MKRILTAVMCLTLAAGFAAFAAACGEKENNTRIDLSKSNLTLAIGETANLTAPGEDQTWSSGDVKVVSVNNYGVVRGVALGKATVTAKTSAGKGMCEVEVKAKITLSKTSVDLFHNPDAPETFDIVEELSPESNPALTGTQKYTYTSENTAVATVSEAGVITSAGDGATKVKITDPNGGEAFVDVNVEGLSNDPVELTITLKSARDVPDYAGVYIRGSINDWLNADNTYPDTAKLTRVDSKTFTFKYETPTRPADPIEFKFVLTNNANKKPDWTYEQTSADNFTKRVNGGVRQMTVEVDWKVIPEPYVPYTGATQLTIEVTTANPLPTGIDIYIVGQWSGWTADNASYKLSLKNGTTKTYTITVTVDLTLLSVGASPPATDSSEFAYQMTFGDWDNKCMEGGSAINRVISGLNGTARTVTHTIADPT